MTTCSHFFRKQPWPMQALLLAGIYFLTGKLSLLLAIPPGYATAIWPPSGIALAAILICGYRVWPGVLVGSFLVNYSTTVVAQDSVAFAASLGITLLISAGAALQAVVGGYLVRRYARFPSPLANPREIVAFFCFGGLLGALVNSTLAVSTLVLGGRISPDNAFSNWSTWWLGDVMGVMIFAPLVIFWLYRQDRPFMGRQLAISIPLFAMFCLTTAAVFYESRNESERLRSQFDRHAFGLRLALEGTIHSYLNELQALESFFMASSEIDQAEFKTFVSRSLINFKGIQALEWAPVVALADRDAFERHMRSEGQPMFRITEKDERQQLIPAGARPEYYPVTFMGPMAGNESALGFDLGSNPVRREALNRARDTGSLSITSRVTLVQEHAHQYGVLAVLPVFRSGLRDGDPRARHQKLTGFVIAAFRGGDIVSSALKDIDTSGLSYRLYDQSAPPGAQLLYASAAGRHAPLSLVRDSLLGPGISLFSDSVIEVGGRQWRFEVIPTQGYLSRHRSGNSMFILLGGLLLTGVVAVFVMAHSGRGNVLERLVEERTRALSQSEEDLYTVFSQSPDGIVVFDRGKVLLHVNEAFCRITGLRMDQLIGLTEERFDGLMSGLCSPGIQYPVTASAVSYGVASFAIEKAPLPRRRADDLADRVDLAVPEQHTLMRSLIDLDQQHLGRLMYFRDVTSETLVDRMKSDFLSTAAHELRTPMSIIMGYAELLKTGSFEPEMRARMVDSIYAQSQSIVTLLNELLDLARIEARAGKAFAMAMAPIGPIILGLADSFLMAGDPRKVRLATLPELPHLMIDAEKIGQALKNCLSNAFKFSDGDAEVAMRVTLRSCEEGKEVAIEIIDHGIGMTSEQLSHLFERFYRADTSGKIPGTGLGLALVKEIMDHHRGTVSVASTPGQGTVVTLALPVPAIDPGQAPQG